MTLYTVGHSNVPLDTFLSSLTQNSITTLVDIRSFPSSRHCPHFSQESLSSSLNEVGIEYRWMKVLGGRRHSVNPSSVNIGLRHPAFRSYADYMETQLFKNGMEELLAIEGYVAYMCSEAVYWRCHRRLVSDYLTFRGVEVQHIAVNSGALSKHSLTEPCHWSAGNVVYS